MRRFAAIFAVAAERRGDVAALEDILAKTAPRLPPELAAALDREGARREAIQGIASFLESQVEAGSLRPLDDPAFAAEQFLQLVVSVPQRRALGLGTPLSEPELHAWARNAVKLFLEGCGKSVAGI
jgi:hypothetical protein